MVGEHIIKLIIFILLIVIAGFLGLRYRGWSKEGLKGSIRYFLIVLIIGIAANAIFDIVKTKFWNNVEEENTVETQTKAK